MKTRKLILFTYLIVSSSIILSCEPYRYININGKKKFLANPNHNCEIEISAGILQINNVDFKIISNRDSIRIVNLKEWLNELTEINKEYFESSAILNNVEAFSNKPFILKAGEPLKFPIRTREGWINDKIPFIFPKSNLILCQGKPLFEEAVECILAPGRNRFIF
ncbi:hypothetical protein [Sphingobacterium siyangense]|uniref:hypothetical protein n=1 Tax=Sphingobacterium siyangense TaxID=459529 RepID=UPI0031F89225